MVSLSLRVCGCAGTHPGPGRACSGYLVTATREDGGHTRLLLDCGNGSLANLQRACDVTDLDAVVLSHAHPDHCVDVYGLYYALRFHPAGEARVPVYAPAGTRETLGHLIRDTGGERFDAVCPFTTVAAGDRVRVGDLEISFGAANHPVATVTTRVTAAGRVLAYSGDTHMSDDVVAAADGADVFLCDATWSAAAGPYPAGVHATGEEAGTMAAAAGARRLVVTHVLPTVDTATVADEAAGRFGGEVVAATDGLELTV